MNISLQTKKIYGGRVGSSPHYTPGHISAADLGVEFLSLILASLPTEKVNKQSSGLTSSIIVGENIQLFVSSRTLDFLLWQARRFWDRYTSLEGDTNFGQAADMLGSRSSEYIAQVRSLLEIHHKFSNFSIVCFLM